MIWEQAGAVSHQCSGYHGRQSICSLDRWPYSRHASHGHYGSLCKCGKRKDSQLNEGQAIGWRPYPMDGELSLRKNSGDDNQGQRHGQTPSGRQGSTGLTCVTDSLCNLPPWPDQMDRRVHPSLRAASCG